VWQYSTSIYQLLVNYKVRQRNKVISPKFNHKEWHTEWHSNTPASIVSGKCMLLRQHFNLHVKNDEILAYE
jgi:hypothetical protein